MVYFDQYSEDYIREKGEVAENICFIIMSFSFIAVLVCNIVWNALV